MKRCIKCLKPDTLPGVEFVDGVCPACIRYENRKNINWEQRQDFLAKLCNEHRSKNGSYDCIIPVSGGKDSFAQVKKMVVDFNMNPLLVCVTDPFTHTKEGIHNHQQICRAFDCDMITLNLSPRFVIQTSRATFEQIGSTNWVVDKAIYAWPLQVAIEKGIKLVVYGENVSWEYGGPNAEDTYDANKQILNGVVNEKGEKIIRQLDPDGKRSNCLHMPTPEAIKASQLQAIYMSYFYPWNDLENVEVAEQYGFKRLVDRRYGYIDDYAQIDSWGYLMNYYLKYLKYGIGRIVDIGSRWVRYGKITKEGLAKQIEWAEGSFDETIFMDFQKTLGYKHSEARDILLKWANRDIFNVDDIVITWKDIGL